LVPSRRATVIFSPHNFFSLVSFPSHPIFCSFSLCSVCGSKPTRHFLFPPPGKRLFMRTRLLLFSSCHARRSLRQIHSTLIEFSRSLFPPSPHSQSLATAMFFSEPATGDDSHERRRSLCRGWWSLVLCFPSFFNTHGSGSAPFSQLYRPDSEKYHAVWSSPSFPPFHPQAAVSFTLPFILEIIGVSRADRGPAPQFPPLL